jgi:ribosomal protein S17E
MTHSEHTEILKTWEKKRLHTYELIKELHDDEDLRKTWVKRRARAILNKNPDLDQAEVLETTEEFFDRLEILNKEIKETGKPTVHIYPRKIGKYKFSELLGVTSKNLAGCVTRMVDSAADDIIKGYRKGVILSDVFGKEFRDRFNSYVKKRVNQVIMGK